MDDQFTLALKEAGILLDEPVDQFALAMEEDKAAGAGPMDQFTMALKEDAELSGDQFAAALMEDLTNPQPIPPEKIQLVRAGIGVEGGSQQTIGELPAAGQQMAPAEAITVPNAYLNEAQKAFKFAMLSHLPEDEAVRKAETYSWGDVIGESWGAQNPTNLAGEWGRQMLGDVLEGATKPSSYLLAFGLDKALKAGAVAMQESFPRLWAFINKPLFGTGAEGTKKAMAQVVADFKAGNVTPEVEELISRGRTAPEMDAFKGYLGRKGYAFNVDVPVVPEGQGLVRPQAAEAAKVVGPGVAAGAAGEQIPKYAGNINLSHFTPEAQAKILEVVRKEPSVGETKHVSHKELIEKANKMMEFPIIKRILGYSSEQLAAETVAHRRVVDDIFTAALDDETKDVGALVDELTKLKRTAAKQEHKVASSVGRALGAYNIDTGRVDRVRAIQDRLAKFLTDPVVKSNPLVVAKTERLMKMVARDEADPTLIDKAYEAWVNSIFSGPWTHAWNITGNLIFAAEKIPQKLVSAAVDVPTSWFTGRRQTFAAEALGQLKGAGKYLKGERMASPEGTKMDDRRRMIGGGVGAPEWERKLGEVVNIPVKALAAMDTQFKNLVGLMHKTGIEAGREAGLKMTPSRTEREVASEQLYRTFQDEVGRLAKAMMGLRANVPGVRWIMPVLRTAERIAEAGVKRTPAGLAIAGIKAGRSYAGANKYTQRQFTDDVAAALMGSTVMGLTAYLWSIGRMTSGLPEKPEHKDRMWREGKMPNSFKVGDKWVDATRFEPYGTVMSIMGNFLQDYVESNKDVPTAKLMDAMFGIGQTLIRKQYFDGAIKFIDGLTDSDKGAKMLQNMVGGGVPGIVNFARTVQDPVVREPEGLVEAILNRVPWLSKHVPAKINAFGEEVVKSRIPMVSGERTSDADKALDAYGVDISLPDRKLSGYKLTREEYQQYKVEVGKEIKSSLDNFIKSAYYEATPEEMRGDVLDGVVRDAKELVRKQWMDRFWAKIEASMPAGPEKDKWLSQKRLVPRVRNPRN